MFRALAVLLTFCFVNIPILRAAPASANPFWQDQQQDQQQAQEQDQQQDQQQYQDQGSSVRKLFARSTRQSSFSDRSLS